jgi:hypothetical protein
MDYQPSNRQDKRDSKKKQSSHSIYTSKHTRIAAEVAAKHSVKPDTSKSKSK